MRAQSSSAIAATVNKPVSVDHRFSGRQIGSSAVRLHFYIWPNDNSECGRHDCPADRLDRTALAVPTGMD